MCLLYSNVVCPPRVRTAVNALTASVDTTPQVWAGTDHWLIGVLNATVMARSSTLYNQVANGKNSTGPHIFYVYTCTALAPASTRSSARACPALRSLARSLASHPEPRATCRYNLPDPYIAATALVRVLTGAMISLFKQLLDNFRSYSTTGPRVNLTVIYDNTTGVHMSVRDESTAWAILVQCK